MNLHKLRVFCEVVERQSLTLAAEQLVVTTPVVSAHIRDLEEFFGARLLYQQGRRMLPTEAGDLVYQHATEVLRASEETVSQVRRLGSGAAGRVVVGANMGPGTYILPPLLTAFQLERPGAEITLLLAETVAVCEQLHRGAYEFAVLAVPEPPPGVSSELLREEPLVLFANPHHPLIGPAPVAARALADEPFVCSPIGNARRRVIDARLRELGLPTRRLVMTLGHPEAIKQAVRDGLGLAVLYRSSIQRELRAGELAEIHLEGPELTHPIYLIHNARKRFSPIQQYLLEFVKAASQQPQPPPTQPAS